MSRWRRTFLLALVAAILAACGSLGPEGPTQPVDPSPSAAGTPMSTPWPSPTPPPADSGWQVVAPGLEQRVINLVSGDGEWLENIILVRLEPAQFQFDVRYRPGEPQDLRTWQRETDAILVVNGGFFTENYQATGLIVVNGEPSGVSYEGFGGMFAVTDQGPDLRWLPEQPYQAQEALDAALQSFPMLLTPGGVVGVSQEDGQQARRTVVALDRQQRLLFLVFNRGHFTLYELSRYLAESDLALDVALNLDGGASSGLYLSRPEVYVPAFSVLPGVITVRERSES